MPRARWSAKRERQYQHIKHSAQQHGKTEHSAERIAAATVNKDRARAGESLEASSSSLRGPSPERRGGLNSHAGAQGPTKASLYREAAARGIHGRSKMSKSELKAALSKG